jgi:riboflavin-specific deaminase-like protein
LAGHIVIARKRHLKKPFVTVKFAQSVDGRIATSTGDSRWISGPAARRLTHKLRGEHDAIMVGIGTVLADDPELTVRFVKGRDPLRVIVDSKLRTPVTARVLAGDAASGTLIATSANVRSARAIQIQKRGADVVCLPREKNGKGVDLLRLFEQLARRGITSVLVEGGTGIITSLLAIGAVDRLIAIIAPKIIGKGTEAIGDLGITQLSEALLFSSVKVRRLGDDLIFDGRLLR